MRYMKYCITYIHHDIDKYSLCQGQITISLVFFSPEYYNRFFLTRFCLKPAFVIRQPYSPASAVTIYIKCHIKRFMLVHTNNYRKRDIYYRIVS